jgi:hypothetical protein
MLSAIMGCSLWKDLIRDNNADQAEQHADRDNEPVTVRMTAVAAYLASG